MVGCLKLEPNFGQVHYLHILVLPLGPYLTAKFVGSRGQPAAMACTGFLSAEPKSSNQTGRRAARHNVGQVSF